MDVKFVLVMRDAIVNKKKIDKIVIEWDDVIEIHRLPILVLQISQEWAIEKHFLTNRMKGLTQVGESTLSIEPLTL